MTTATTQEPSTREAQEEFDFPMEEEQGYDWKFFLFMFIAMFVAVFGAMYLANKVL